MELFKLVNEGNPVFLYNVRDLDKEVKDKPENITVTNEFLDVLPEENPGIPPNRPIDFTIDLAPGNFESSIYNNSKRSE